MGKIITLTTDFGLNDHYAGAIKGVMLSVNSDAVIVNISHSVTAGDIKAGAFVMAGACRYFPPGTVHTGVVDPGVGGSRRAVIVETKNFLFVGPDNGLLSLAAEADGIRRIIEIKENSFCRSNISSTFHGRDIFGPVAGHLTLGVEPGEFGPESSDLLMINVPRVFLIEGDGIIGAVLQIDTYGNIITNIEAAQVECHFGTSKIELILNGQSLKGLYRTYNELTRGVPGALAGSGGFVEVALREANCAASIGVAVGDKVRLVKS